MKEQGLSLRAIARQLGRHPSTISRELRRNQSEQGYVAREAHQKARIRWQECHRRLRLKSPELRALVRRKLTNGFSPEIIAGRLRDEGHPLPISHEAIYQWIYHEARDLIPHLLRAHRRRLPRRYHKKTRLRIPEWVSINERPAAVDERREAGHWEVDTIFSRQGPTVLAVAAERKTRYVRLKRLPEKTARGMSTALIQALGQYPESLRRTMTYDNGAENAEHLLVNRALGTRSYFCTPYHSWEKGTVEQTIGLIRRYYPKGTNFSQVTDEHEKWAERKLNNRPRKCLNYKTPAEAFRMERCT